jgi:hypothetical protein
MRLLNASSLSLMTNVVWELNDVPLNSPIPFLNLLLTFLSFLDYLNSNKLINSSYQILEGLEFKNKLIKIKNETNELNEILTFSKISNTEIELEKENKKLARIFLIDKFCEWFLME